MPEYWDNIRIQQLHDTEENWKTVQASFTPEEGEIVIYDSDEDNPYPRMKVGGKHTSGDKNGQLKTLEELPFTTSETVTVNPDDADNKKEYKIVTTTDEAAGGEDSVITIILYDTK